MKKRWLRLSSISISVIAVIILAACILLQSPPVTRFIFRQIRSYLQSSSDIDLRASRMDFNLFKRTITLENVVLQSTASPELPPFLKASRIYARPGIINAIRGIVDVEELQVTAPQIYCFVRQDGETNLPAGKNASRPAPKFLIAAADLTNGSFRYQDLRAGMNLSLPQWRMQMNGNRLTLDHRIDFTAQRAGSLQFQNRTVPLEYVKFLGTLKRNGMHIELARMASRHSELSGEGSLADFSNPVLSLQIEPNLDLDESTSILGMRKPFRGRLSGKINMNGSLRKLDLMAELKGLDITAGPYANTTFDFRGSLLWSSPRILLHNFQLTSPQGSINGHAEIFTEPGAGTNSIQSDLRELDLYPIWKLINPPFDLATRSSGKLSLRWKGSFKASNIEAATNLTLSATRSTPLRYILPVSGGFEAQMRSGRLQGNFRELSVMGTRLNGPFSLASFETVNAEIGGGTENVGSALSQVSQFIGSSDPSLIGIRMEGPARFNAQVGGRLANPRIAATLDSPALLAGKLKDLRVKADAVIQDAQVPFKVIAALPDNSTVSANGSLGFGGGKTTLNVDARTDHIPVAAVLPVLGVDIPVAGDLRSNLHLEGPFDGLAGNVQISGDRVAVYKEPLGRFDMDLRISEGEIRSNQFRIIRNSQNPDSNYIDATFSYMTGSGQFQFQATGKDLIWEQQQLPGGKILDGAFNLTASGLGTFAHPSLDVQLQAGEIRVRQHSIGPVSVSAILRDEKATIEANASQFNSSCTIHAETSSPYPFESELQIRNSDLSVLGLQVANKQPLTGTFAATLRGSGNLDDVAGGQFQAQIQRLELHAGSLEVHTEGVMEAEYRDKSIAILKPGTIVSGNSRLEISGKAPLQQTATSGSLTLKGQIDLAQAAGFLTVPKGFSASGKLNLDLSFTGAPQKLSTGGTIILDDGLITLPQMPVPLSRVLLRASLQNGALMLQRAEAALGPGMITLSGELPFGLLPRSSPIQFLRKEGPAHFNIDIAGLRPETTGILPQGVEGLISVHADGQATGMNLRALDADIVFRELNFRANEIAFGQKENSRIVVRNGIASISTLSLTGAETSIEAAGSAGLFPEGPLSLKLFGSVDAGLLTFMNRDLKAAGRVRVQVAIGGSRRAPSLSGVAEMDGGRLTLREPRVVADSLTVRLGLAPNQVRVQEFKSTLNGGTLTMSGTIGYQRGILDNFNLKATVQDVFMDFPDGLKSASNGTLTVTSADESIVVGGTIRVLESSYRESFEVAGRLMSFLRSPHVVVESTEANPLLDRIRFNIGLRTTAPLLVQNNIAKVEATANVRIVGSFYEPSLIGRVTLDQGGEIVMNQRTYYIERGTITLNDQTQVRPELDIEAQTKVDTYDITLRLTGPLERLSTVLSSEPSLPEPDILSLLLTGKVSSESTQQVARTQALALVAGQAGEEVTRSARQALHLSTFRIDPGGLIASESDLGARLTIGEDVTKDLNLAYSMNLVDGGKQIWAAQYRVVRRLTTQATKQEDNSYRFEFRHDLRFGGPPSTGPSRTASSKFTIGSIQFEGGSPTSDKTLLEKFKVKPGDKYDFPKVQKGLDRLHDFYFGQKRLEADIRMQRETQGKTVDLDISIAPGPLIEFSYEGMPLSAKVKENVDKAWRNGVFDVERLDDAGAVIYRLLLRDGYLQPEITHRIETEGDKKTVHFHIEPGKRYAKVPVVFPGASEISAAELNNALNRAGLELDIYADPQKVADFLKQYYRDRGYLQAKVDLPQLHLEPNGGTGEVAILLHEGALFTVGNLEFSGNTAFDYDQLWSVIPTSSGSIYSPKSMQDAAKAVENQYRSKGYNEASATFRVVENSETAHADVTFQITERRQSIIRDIVVEGNESTSRDFVQRQLDFKVGDALNLDKIDEMRRRLYATGAYSSVDFQNEEMQGSAPDSREKDIRIRVRLREIRPYRIQYGFYYDTDRGPGGLFEAQNLNLLGRATTLGMKLRYDSDLKEARLYFNQPFVTRNFLRLDASAFVQREDRVAFSANRIGFSIFREKALARKYMLDYGYRYDHVRWNGLPPDPTLFQASVPVARLVATITRDTRDSILDATRGEFASHSLEFGPRFLGSEIGFTRYSGQYFRYVPLDKYLGKPVKDKEGNRLPATFVYAGALRLGLTSSFGGQDIISPERFFAGGGTTMRGFQQDLLGPTVPVVDPETGQTVQRPTGGEALFLFNNEIRFPIISVFQGVGFVDIGNVYPRISDFDFTLRKSAGFGLRIKIKFIPIRFDYGFKLDRRPGESQGAFFFSIGQAF